MLHLLHNLSLKKILLLLAVLVIISIKLIGSFDNQFTQYGENTKLAQIMSSDMRGH